MWATGPTVFRLGDAKSDRGAENFDHSLFTLVCTPYLEITRAPNRMYKDGLLCKSQVP